MDNQTNIPEESPVASAFVNINDTIRQRIDGSTPAVIDGVVDIIANAEIKRRIDIAHKGVLKLREMENNLKKSNHPDIKVRDASGTEIKNFSDQKWKEIEKTKKDIAEFSQTLENALTKNTADAYDKLSGKLSGGGNRSES